MRSSARSGALYGYMCRSRQPEICLQKTQSAASTVRRSQLEREAPNDSALFLRSDSDRREAAPCVLHRVATFRQPEICPGKDQSAQAVHGRVDAQLYVTEAPNDSDSLTANPTMHLRREAALCGYIELPRFSTARNLSGRGPICCLNRSRARWMPQLYVRSAE